MEGCACGWRSVAVRRLCAPCPSESVNFDITQNLYIEGDNLEVLKLLQTPYFRKVKMMYIEIIIPSLIQGIGKIKKCAIVV